MRISFLLYPTEKVKVNEDSSFWIMHELKKRGHAVSYFESRDLLWMKGSPHAYLTPARLDETRGYLPSKRGQTPTNLSSLDCVFIRKEPPFGNDYLYSLQMLEAIKKQVFVLNDPAGIAICNEKLFSLWFKDYCPETLVTDNVDEARKFIRHLKRPVIVKPLNQKGGVGIFTTFARDRNLPSLLQIAMRLPAGQAGPGRKKVMIQRFIPAARSGDRRILILNGRPLGAFGRRPSPSDFRANLSTGGTMHRSALSAWDKKLVEKTAPELLAYGLFFVGIDVIGRYLTEVNVTSPAGIPEINAFNHTHLEKEVAGFIEAGRPASSGRKHF